MIKELFVFVFCEQVYLQWLEAAKIYRRTIINMYFVSNLLQF